MNTPFFKALHPQVSLDTDFVTIPFGKDIYRIPRNYLVSATEPAAPGKYAQFTLEVLLPDFEPRTPDNIDRFNAIGTGDKLLALIEFGTSFDPPSVVLPRILSGNLCKYYITKDGDYEHYHLKYCGTNGDFYLTNLKDGGKFYMECESHKDFPSPACTILENIGENRTIDYSFGTKYLYHAVVIDEYLRNIVKYFDKK